MTYDMGKREKAIDNKGPRELFKGLCLPYFSEMFIRGLNIHDKKTVIMLLYYMAVPHKDWELPNSRI